MHGECVWKRIRSDWPKWSLCRLVTLCYVKQFCFATQLVTQCSRQHCTASCRIALSKGAKYFSRIFVKNRRPACFFMKLATQSVVVRTICKQGASHAQFVCIFSYKSVGLHAAEKKSFMSSTFTTFRIYSGIPLYKHPLSKDTRILRTVSFVPTRKYRLLHGWWARTIFVHELWRIANERVSAANEWVFDSSQQVNKNRISEPTMK